MMDTDTDTVEWFHSSHFVYNVLGYWQTGEWEVLTAGSTVHVCANVQMENVYSAG